MIPLELLHAVRDRYPDAWRLFDSLLAKRESLMEWPPYVHCPMAGAVAIIDQHGGSREDIALLSALAAWRPTQGIYRFDPDLGAAIDATDVDRELPADVLRALPEWCVWIELEGHRVGGLEAYGYFAHLEWDAHDGHEELRLLIALQGKLLQPVAIHLGGTLLDGIDRWIDESLAQQALARGFAHDPTTRKAREAMAASLAPLVSRVLYLCSETPDLEDPKARGRLPKRAALKHRKKGRAPILLAAQRPAIWHTGYRIGAALREARELAGESSDERQGPTPHVRRAHWHTHWIGPLKSPERRRVLRWHAPTLVGFKVGEELSPTVRRVR